MKPSDDPENWDVEVLEHLRDDILRQDAAAQTGLQQIHDHALSMFRICFIVIGFPVTAIGLFGGDVVSVSTGEAACLALPLSLCVSPEATVIVAFVLLFVGMLFFLATAGITSSAFFQSISSSAPNLYLVKEEKEYLVSFVSDFVRLLEEGDRFPFVLYGFLYTGFACVLAALLLTSGVGYVVVFGERLPAIISVVMLILVVTPFLFLLLFISERRMQRWVRWVQKRFGRRRPEPKLQARNVNATEQPSEDTEPPSEDN